MIKNNDKNGLKYIIIRNIMIIYDITYSIYLHIKIDILKIIIY